MGRRHVFELVRIPFPPAFPPMNSRSSLMTRLVLALALVSAACSSRDTGTGPLALPASISKVSGDNQTGTVGNVLPSGPVVRVLDASGNPVANARVQWEASAGSGAPQPSVSFTNSDGQTTTQWTLGQVSGNAQLTAQVGGVLPAVFGATALPGAPALVVSLPDVASVNVGDTLRIRSTVRDQFGNEVQGQSVTYSTPDASVASVSNTGLVTALTEGIARIIATASTRADTVHVTVVTTNASACGDTPLQVLEVGDVYLPQTSGSSTRVCLGAPEDAAADYGAVLVSSNTAFGSTLSADVFGLGIDGPTSQNMILFPSMVGDQRVPAQLPLSLDGPLPIDRGAELRLRMRERRELAGLDHIARERFGRGTRGGKVAAAMQPRAIEVGDLLQLNSNPLTACTSPDTRTGRVAAVGTHSIIVADNANPAGGYSDAEFAEIAAMFDTLIYPLDVEAFGTPTDVSGYGRIILFYTSAVNQLTPQNAGFLIGGFFFARDLYPRTASNGLPACAASNEAEIMYLLVPDPNGTINNNRRSKDDVTRVNIGTVTHELQHLINSSRRLYVNAGAVRAEETWLDEGLSHVAEELLYLRLAGYGIRDNLDIDDVAGNSAKTTTFSNYGIQNFGRFYDYLRNPEANSPYAINDSLATRGATWSFLRYAAMRESVGNEEAFLHRLVNSTTAGINNLSGSIPANQFGDYLRDWALALLADDYSAQVMANLEPKFTNPTWNFRSIYPSLRISGQTLNVYPLSTRSLFNNIPQRVTLPGGGTSYIRFSVDANTEGLVSFSSNGGALPAVARVGVVRLK